jgi:protein LTV1
MPRKRWIDKNNAQTFKLLYRSQDDPLIHDQGERALFPIDASSSSTQPSSKTGLHIEDLEDDVDLESMRDNEGEAAEYGIYYDDTKYDYMQHLKDLGDGAGEAHFVDAMPVKYQGKGKGKARAMKLEDALAQASLDDEDEAPSLVQSTNSRYGDAYSSFSTSTKDRQLESQQNVPDEIAGFQPDMDPRLREVLEALEDDAYVDDKDDDDVFGALGQDGKHGELSLDEFEYDYGPHDEDDDGWESDATEKAPNQPPVSAPPVTLPRTTTSTTTNEFTVADAEAAAAQDGDWLRDFAKFKREQTTSTRKPAPLPAAGSIIAASSTHDAAPTLYTLGGTPLRQKKRKGAQTNPSAYSMTSSSLARTDGQQLLDARFDQVEKMYALDEGDEDLLDDNDGGVSLVSGMSKMSKMSALSTTSFADEGAVRQDLNGLMDGFLGDWDKANPGGGKRAGKKGKRGKHGNERYGLQQLDELRAELGPARVTRSVPMPKA